MKCTNGEKPKLEPNASIWSDDDACTLSMGCPVLICEDAWDIVPSIVAGHPSDQIRSKIVIKIGDHVQKLSDL